MNAAKLIYTDLSYASVLIVDDMRVNLDIAKGMLKPYGLHVDCALCGQQAIDIIRAEKTRYDVVFMDHLMPGIDGNEATRIIREQIGTDYARTVPIVALTANAKEGNEEMLMRKGFQASISKPIDMIKLDSVLRRLVRDKSKDAGSPGQPIPLHPPSAELPECCRTISIPGLKVEKGLALFNDCFETYLAVLRSYAVNTPAVTESMHNVTALNLSDYRIHVHGLKGSSINIGANVTGEMAASMEAKATAGDLQGVLDGNDELLENVQELVTAIQAWLDEYDAAVDKPRLHIPDPQLLKSLLIYCEQYSMSGVNRVLNELESACYDEGNDLIRWLRERADVSDFAAIAERISAISA